LGIQNSPIWCKASKITEEEAEAGEEEEGRARRRNRKQESTSAMNLAHKKLPPP